ncbi:leucine rich repeat protein [Cystoisospora suis]|uniref:Leucine rich repeat protein n=1 Tax=Cystoisospora suis TaxID=483139 RepID=A0A2C6L289_9APIC|nr:leucine rich repeat protein [Cystoisospora suis]
MFARDTGSPSSTALQPLNPHQSTPFMHSRPLEPGNTAARDSGPRCAFLARLRRACGSSNEGTTAGGCLNLSMLGLEALPEEALDLGKAAAVLGLEWWSLSDWARVDISFNAIRELPYGVPDAEVERSPRAEVKYHELWPVLQFFIARENKLTSLPEAFCVLPNLKHLDLTGNSLISLPANFSSLSALVELRIGNNKLQRLPNDLHLLHSLAVIDCSHNSLVEIPRRLLSCACPALQSLICSFNQIRQLSVGQCMCAGSCDASASPSPSSPVRSPCSRLEVLECASNCLVSLPEGFGMVFSRLRQLDLRNNFISDLPSAFPPSSIQRLILANNRITSFPASSSNSPLACPLSVSRGSSYGEVASGSHVKPGIPSHEPSVPSASFLSRCAHLSVLDISSNKIECLAETDWQYLSSLATLDVRNNELTDIPNALGFLPSLQRLYVSGNRIKKIRSSLINDFDDAQSVTSSLGRSGGESCAPANRTVAERIHQLKLYLRGRAGGETGEGHTGASKGERRRRMTEAEGTTHDTQTTVEESGRKNGGGNCTSPEKFRAQSTRRHSPLLSHSPTVSSLSSLKDTVQRSDNAHSVLSSSVAGSEGNHKASRPPRRSLSRLRCQGPGRPDCWSDPRRETYVAREEETRPDLAKKQGDAVVRDSLSTRTALALEENRVEEVARGEDENWQNRAGMSRRREMQREVSCPRESRQQSDRRTRKPGKSSDRSFYQPPRNQAIVRCTRPGRKECLPLPGRSLESQVHKTLSQVLSSQAEDDAGQRSCCGSRQADIHGIGTTPSEVSNKGDSAAASKPACQREAVQLAKEIEEIDERIREDLSLGRVDILQLKREKAKKMAARNRIMMQQQETLN